MIYADRVTGASQGWRYRLAETSHGVRGASSGGTPHEFHFYVDTERRTEFIGMLEAAGLLVEHVPLADEPRIVLAYCRCEEPACDELAAVVEEECEALDASFDGTVTLLSERDFPRGITADRVPPCPPLDRLASVLRRSKLR